MVSTFVYADVDVDKRDTNDNDGDVYDDDNADYNFMNITKESL